MIGHYQHCELRPAQNAAKLVSQLVDFPLKPGADIVDRGKQYLAHHSTGICWLAQ